MAGASARTEALTGWVHPDAAATIAIEQAVQECLELVRTEWSVRGIELVTHLDASQRMVSSWAFREVLAAMLVALGDSMPGAADVTLRIGGRGGNLVVSIRGRAAVRSSDPPRAAYPRRLRWDDARVLACAHAVAWARRGDRAIAWFGARSE